MRAKRVSEHELLVETLEVGGRNGLHRARKQDADPSDDLMLQCIRDATLDAFAERFDFEGTPDAEG